MAKKEMVQEEFENTSKAKIIDDDGYESLKYDCKYLDMIHIDPWKKYPKFEDGLKETIKMTVILSILKLNMKLGPKKLLDILNLMN